MRQALAWLRSNVLTVISVAAAIGSVAFLYTYVVGQRAAFQQELQRRAGEQNSIRSHIDRAVNIPSEDPSQPRKTINITVNADAVRALEQVFQRVNSSYDTLFHEAVDFNRYGPLDDQGQPLNPHLPMVEGLFPNEPSDTLLFQAPRAYLAEFTRLYRLLEAGPAPNSSEIQQRAATARSEYLAMHPNSPEQDPDLQDHLAGAQLRILMDRARQIQVYGEPPTPAAQMGSASTGMFYIEQWASLPDKPRMGQLWEAQMQVWIQQDIVQAIRLANRSSNGGSVLDNPVKRVLSIAVEPAGYVGLSAVPAEENPREPPQPQVSIDQPLPDNFIASPTGRQCNPLYDVRFAYVSLIVDSRKLPTLMNAFGRVNYLTPIIQRITRIDQQQHISEGYLYGDKVDVVQVDLMIESVWMRRWTAGHWNAQTVPPGEQFDPGLMPDVARYHLGLPVRSATFNPQLIAGDVVPVASAGAGGEGAARIRPGRSAGPTTITPGPPSGDRGRGIRR